MKNVYAGKGLPLVLMLTFLSAQHDAAAGRKDSGSSIVETASPASEAGSALLAGNDPATHDLVCTGPLPLDKDVFAENPEGPAPHSTNIIVNHYEEGIMYELRKESDNSLVAGPQPGSIGLYVQGVTQTTTYYVIGRNPNTGCETVMTSRPTITITSAPCTPPADKALVVEDDSGTAPHSTNIHVQNPQAGILYSLRLNSNNSVVDGPQPGTEPLFTGQINQTTQYNVLASNSQTGCEAVMSTRPTITITSEPCTPPADKSLVVEDDSGTAPHSTNILVQNPQAGILYSLRLNSNNTVVDGPQVGTEPLFTGQINQTTQYNVLAHDPQTGCETVMSTRPVVTVTQPPGATSLYPDLFSWAKAGTYMHDVKIETSQGRKLLRFSTASTNKGAGPFELRATVESDGTTTATQRIYDGQGGYIDRHAGTFVFQGHEDHSHFHFQDFANYRLLAVLANNGVGSVIRASDKVSFAMFDVAAYDLSLPGAPASRVYLNPESSLDPQGISVGWADVYPRYLDGQWIDITGVPDGQYWLEVTMDPSGLIAELDDTNNTSYVKVIIRGKRANTTSDQPSGAPAAGRIAERTADTVRELETEFSQTVALYPNPSRGQFDVVIDDDYIGPYSLQLRDLSGRALTQQTLMKETRIASTRIDMNQAPKGLYVLSVHLNGVIRKSKVVITD